VVDRERVLAKLDELRGYIGELQAIVPNTIDEYRRTALRRACERLLQVSIECVIDVCSLLVAGSRLGLPAEEDDLIDKLESSGVVTGEIRATLRQMKGCRNILVQQYGRVLDEIIFEPVSSKLGDFGRFNDRPSPPRSECRRAPRRRFHRRSPHLPRRERGPARPGA
jgi:uncharacterized protein YutE (UPF0331/DUF86 family)